MKLELKHIVGYLPYGLEFTTSKHQIRYGECDILKMNGLSIDVDGKLNIEFLHDDDLLFSNNLNTVKPLLRPLSQLTEEIDQNGIGINVYDEISSEYPNCNGFKDWVSIYSMEHKICDSLAEYCCVKLLEKYHFDIHGLIEVGLAIEKK